MSIRTWWARYVRRPFQGAGRATALLAAGVAVLLGGLLAVGLLWALLAAFSLWSIVSGWAGAWVVAVVAAVAAAPLLTWTQRQRFRLLSGVGIAVPEGLAERPGLRGMVLWLRSAAGRRQLRYHFLAGPLIVLGGALMLACWVAGAAAATVYLWIWVTPTHWRIDNPGYTTTAAYVTVAGVALLYGTGWFTKALARVDTAAARTLLGPSREEQLARRVTDLADSRASVIDAADAERRRIERDLHDGAQQRLVALAVNLGLAKATLGDLSDEARAVIDDAHREAKEAITELGNLVRGLHPAVLEDRGLDAALSGIAARLPIPVRVAVDLPRRPLPTIEAVAYFVVSEALTNVVKHARATRAEVIVEQIGGTLLVVVTDDGVGGAELGAATQGTGLAGLAKRVASVDGTLSCHSPVGGPTVITVELPCAP
ncbi:sensor histidine kinase [Catenulispora subtropica]|uniref:sensor histidine kinase n=1 Tax=Catenulispora subtropica TaxID=450798 RepID=UPI0031E1A9E6